MQRGISGIIVALLLYALNIALALFSPSIHAMRLHIVEFFLKFYEGGGVVYEPFKKAVVEKGGGRPFVPEGSGWVNGMLACWSGRLRRISDEIFSIKARLNFFAL
ncbi:MAG: hypothetical protein WC620_04390 [Methanoregula sp.]